MSWTATFFSALYLNTYDKINSSYLTYSTSQGILDHFTRKTHQFVTFDTLTFTVQALIEKSVLNPHSLQFSHSYHPLTEFYWHVLLFTLIHWLFIVLLQYSLFCVPERFSIRLNWLLCVCVCEARTALKEILKFVYFFFLLPFILILIPNTNELGFGIETVICHIKIYSSSV